MYPPAQPLAIIGGRFFIELNSKSNATHRRKEVYERLYPETVHGSNQHSRSRNNCDSTEEAERFTLSTAKATGKSERIIQMNAAIGNKLKKDALDLVGTSLNSITELDALAKLPPPERRSLMDRALAGEQVSAKAAKPKRERAANGEKVTSARAAAHPIEFLRHGSVHQPAQFCVG